MRRASVQSDARKGPDGENGGRVEQRKMRTRTKRPRGRRVSSQVCSRARARAHQSRYSPQPPSSWPIRPLKPKDRETQE